MIVSEMAASPMSGTSREKPATAKSFGYETLKRATDLVLASLLGLITVPILLASMLMVRLTSRGPAIYKQVRLGRANKRYTIYKIRSMYQDCESKSGPLWSAKRDSRVTPFGRILRSTHIDELPQLWNVLRGEMSLVGPRPERPEIAVTLEEVIPCYGDRLQVRPGLTGLAQVQLPPDTSLADVRRKLTCDLYYIRHADIWLDLRILASTVSYVMGIPFDLPRILLRVPSVEAAEAIHSGQHPTRVQVI